MVKNLITKPQVDPWQNILSSLSPTYIKQKELMERGPYIHPELWKNSQRKWAITLQEVWGDNTISDVNLTINFDDAIFWTDEELKKWDCVRSSYDTWIFKKKRDAEKFITLFHLKCPQ